MIVRQTENKKCINNSINEFVNWKSNKVIFWIYEYIVAYVYLYFRVHAWMPLMKVSTTLTVQGQRSPIMAHNILSWAYQSSWPISKAYTKRQKSKQTGHAFVMKKSFIWLRGQVQGP